MPRSILYARLLLCCGLIWRVLAFSGHYLSGHTQRCASKSSLAATQEAIHTESSWVLLAEDDKVLRNKIGENLANEGGYTVTGVADARSAILVCRGAIRSKSNLPSSVFIGNSTNPKQPDCLVIDVSLPGTMNGIDLLKVVRSDPLLEFLPVVLLSERGTAEDRLKGYDAGADAYLSKPFDLEELQSLIDGVLKRGKTSARRHLDNDESDNLIMKTDELRRELAEIKSLLVKSGLNTTTALDGNQFDDKDGSIQQDLVEIKDTILKAPSSDTQSAEESEMLPQDIKHPILLPDEIEIMSLVDKGMTNREISTAMKLPIEIITKKFNELFGKANVKNKTELVKWWKDQRKPAV